jgi:carboxyl-terminal processing protease
LTFFGPVRIFYLLGYAFTLYKMKTAINFIIFNIIFYLPAHSQSVTDYHKEVNNILHIIEKYQIEPPEFDNQFSIRVFDEFLNTLDPNKLFFTTSDYKFCIDNNLHLLSGAKQPAWKLPETITNFYKSGLKQYDSILKQSINQILDISQHEYYKPALPGNIELTVMNINQRLKLKIISRLVQLMDSGFKLNDYKSLEARVQQKIIKSEEKKISDLLNQPDLIDKTIFSAYLHALVNCCDPHSEFMSFTDKKKFESYLQSKSLSFGFSVSITDKNELLIERLTPGGPAWKSKLLHIGDIITAINLPGKEKMELEDMDVRETDEILNSPRNIRVGFFVRAKDGNVHHLELEKTQIVADDNIVRAYIISGPVKVGYISLPDFYTQFENQSEPGCTNDIAKECFKLQKENISGLILDLRNNGGGSVKEAIDLAGLFIDYGPICQIKEKNRKPRVIKDFNRGMAFSSPLVILTNRRSASATELFSAAMQDYHRAVIIGDTTFGKATGQIFIPTDSSAKMTYQNFIKLSVERLYRISGKSVQKTGIIPDILLPDLYSGIKFGEAWEKSSLNPDSASKSSYLPLSDLPLKELNRRSKLRTTISPNFNSIKNITRELHEFSSESSGIPLEINEFYSNNLRRNSLISELNKNLLNADSVFSVQITKFDNSLKSIKSEVDIQQIALISRDIYINEAYYILNDLINITSNSKH